MTRARSLFPLWGLMVLGLASPPPLAKAGPTPDEASSPATPSPGEASAPATETRAPSSRTGRTFRVRYRSAGHVYLDGGREQDLSVGDTLHVFEGEASLAELEVAYVTERSASCAIVSETRPVRVGDRAMLVDGPRTPVAPADGGDVVDTARSVDESEVTGSSSPVSMSTPTASAEASRTSVRLQSVSWGRLRGAASLGYSRSWDRTESALDFEQRTARIDLGLHDIASQPLSVRLRARSRQDIRARTLSARTPRSERTDRLYELAVRYEPPASTVGFEVGRVGVHHFVGIGYLDGGLLRLRLRPGVLVGAFGGRMAEPEGFGFEGGGSKYGAYVELAPGGRYATRGSDATLAFVRENFEGEVSREYLSLESRFSGGRRWSLDQRAELDLNRGWRRELTGQGTQLSNISLSGNLRVTDSSWAFVSYDGRRNYRYARNRLVPEEVFDDLLRQGLRTGVGVARPGGFGATATFGMILKEEDPRHPELALANAYSVHGGLRHANLFGSGVSVGLDGSGFSNGYTDGGVVSARIGVRLGAGHTFDVSYGRSLYRVAETGEDRATEWLRLVGRAELSRWLFVLGDFEYDAGDDLEGPRAFLEVGVVF